MEVKDTEILLEALCYTKSEKTRAQPSLKINTSTVNIIDGK